MRVNAARKNWNDGERYIVELLRASANGWHVYKGGLRIGAVEKGKRTWERPIKGKQYVAARGQVTAWYIIDERFPYDTRGAAIRELVDRTA